jgi:hypothetical protein
VRVPFSWYERFDYRPYLGPALLVPDQENLVEITLQQR